MAELVPSPSPAGEVPVGVTAEAPRPAVRAGDIARSYGELAHGEEALAQGAESLAIPAAQAQAASDLQNQKVTMSPDGKIQVINPAKSLIFGPAGEAYARAAQEGTITQADSLINTHLQEIQIQHQGDPAGQAQANAAFVSGLRGATGNPIIDQAIQSRAASRASERYDNNLEASSRLDLDNKVRSIEASMEDARERLKSLAQAGVPETDPKYQEALNQYNAAQDGRVNDPRMKYPSDQRQLDDKHLQGALDVERQLGGIDRAMTDPQGGGRPRALEIAKGIALRTDISNADKRQLTQDAMARISMHEGDWMENVADLRKTGVNVEQALLTGKAKIDAPEVQAFIARAKGLGDTVLAERLTVIGQHIGKTANLDPLPQTQRLTILGLPKEIQDQINGAPAPQPANASTGASLPAMDRGFFDSRSSGLNSDLAPEFGSRLQAAVTAAEKATGEQARFTSLRRSTEQQAALHANYVNGTGGLAAAPGHSMHESGNAADLQPGSKVVAWLHQHASEFGLEFLHGRAGAVDPGHIQLAAFKPAANAGADNKIGSFDAAMTRTAHEEGGWNGRDANGTPTNFGINQKAHPEVDVRNLTFDQAKAIYKRDYWDAIGGDDLAKTNPGLAHVAFDTAVVDGADRAKQWLAQANGDPNKLLDLREAYERSLVRGDPGIYAKYNATWQNRRDHLRQDLANGEVRGSGGSAGGAGDVVGTGGAGTRAPLFDPADVAAHPELMGPYFASLAKDPEDRWENVHAIGEAIIAQSANASELDTHAVATILQEAAAHPDEQKYQTLAAQVAGAGMAVYAPKGPGELAAKEAEWRSIAANSPNMLDKMAAAYALDYEKKRAEAYKAAPYDVAAARGVLPRAVLPIDPTRPETLSAAILDRVNAGRIINIKGEGATPPLLQPSDVAPFLQIMRGPYGGAALAALASNPNMRPEDLSRLTDEPEVVKAIDGMFHSGNPAQMAAAYATEQKLAEANPQDFDAKFKGGLADMELYSKVVAYMNPDEAARFMRDQRDPTKAAARKQLEEQTRTELKDVTQDTVAARISGSRWFFTGGGPSAPLDPGELGAQALADWKEAYTYARLIGNDPTSAQKVADQKFGIVYAKSDVNNGTLTRYAPEKWYKYPDGSPATVNGSFDWMTKQLNDQVAKALGVPEDYQKGYAAPRVFTDDEQAAINAFNRPIHLHPDNRTDQEAQSRRMRLDANGRPVGTGPSYQVMVEDENGGLQLLTDRNGTPMRISFDIPTDQGKAAFERGRASALAPRATESTPETPHGTGPVEQPAALQ